MSKRKNKTNPFLNSVTEPLSVDHDPVAQDNPETLSQALYVQTSFFLPITLAFYCKTAILRFCYTL